ncbi:MAG: hypothetical protein V4506_12485 [Bacteroidota bacterium]
MYCPIDGLMGSDVKVETEWENENIKLCIKNEDNEFLYDYPVCEAAWGSLVHFAMEIIKQNVRLETLKEIKNRGTPNQNVSISNNT